MNPSYSESFASGCNEANRPPLLVKPNACRLLWLMLTGRSILLKMLPITNRKRGDERFVKSSSGNARVFITLFECEEFDLVDQSPSWSIVAPRLLPIGQFGGNPQPDLLSNHHLQQCLAPAGDDFRDGEDRWMTCHQR